MKFPCDKRKCGRHDGESAGLGHFLSPEIALHENTKEEGCWESIIMLLPRCGNVSSALCGI